MIVDSHNKDKSPLSLHCSICHTKITNRASIFQESLHLGVLCPKCHGNNNQEDLELMANLFLAFGGFFGMNKDVEFDFEATLRELVDEVHTVDSHSSIENLNVKLLHCALLHGITPHQYVETLQDILEE